MIGKDQPLILTLPHHASHSFQSAPLPRMIRVLTMMTQTPASPNPSPGLYKNRSPPYFVANRPSSCIPISQRTIHSRRFQAQVSVYPTPIQRSTSSNQYAKSSL